MADQTFTASYNGKIVGTRRSPRPYAFAVVVQYSEADGRRAAYEYQATDLDRSNWKYAVDKSKAQAGVPYNHGPSRGDPRPIILTHGPKAIAEAQQVVAAGWDAYVAAHRARQITWFEERLAKGYYEPKVHGWSMSAANAQKMANTVGSVLLAIVPAVPKSRAVDAIHAAERRMGA